MADWSIQINSRLLKQDVDIMRQILSQIDGRLEILEVNRKRLEGYWEGAARNTYFQVIEKEWEQFMGYRKETGKGIDKLEKIISLYGECDRQIMNAVESLQV